MIEILINNQRVDVGEVFDILINKSIADVREPEKRSSDWTKTITLPGTKNNNKIFGHIFEIEHTVLSDTQFNTNFNPNKKASAVVLVDGLEQIQGFIRLIKIKVIDTANIAYECSIHGQTADLFSSISEKNLYELDFSEYNHELSIDNVKNSWDTSIKVNNSTVSFQYGNGYVYALLDKDDRKLKSHWVWSLEDTTPCLYAKTIVDKIFTEEGYTYTDDSFFNTERFKHLIIPAPSGLAVNTTSANTRLFQATRTTAQNIANYNTNWIFDNDSTGGNFDNGGNYNPSTGVYTIPVGGNYTFFVNLQGNIDTSDYGFTNDKDIYLTVAIKVNGSIRATSVVSCGSDDVYMFSGEILMFPNVYMYSNDAVSVVVSRVYDLDRPTTPLIGDFVVNVEDSVFYNNMSAINFGTGNVVDFGQFFNAEGKQSDFLVSMIRMFNLYVEPDKYFPKKLRIVPRDEFYNEPTIDLSKKLDYSQPLEIIPMGELNANPYYLTYKDGGDSVNQSYQSYYSQTYGSRKFFIDNQFVKGEKKIELIFQPTQMRSYGSEKNFVLSYAPGDKLGYRILYYSGCTPNLNLSLVTDYSSPSQIASGQQNKLPITLHVDSVSNMTFDLSFGMPREVLLGAGYSYSSNNLFNQYWYRFMYEITNRNSKIVSGYFRLSPADFYNLRFANNYFFEGQYWKLNKVEDYNPMSDGVYKCEFLLSQYIQPFIPSNKTIGAETGSDTITNGETYPYGYKYTTPNQSYINIGFNNDDVNQSMGIINASGTSASDLSYNNTILGGNGNYIPPLINNSTLIACDDFTPTESDTLYYGNYKLYPLWVSAGKVQTLTANHTATTTDWLFLCDTTTGAITITLPDPAGLSGKHWIFKKIASSHSVTIDTADDSTIDGSATFTMNAKNETHWIVTDGNNYYLIADK